MKQVNTKAIVLSRTNYQEADRILTLLSPDHGKIKVIAKGVRKLKSKLAGGLELLSVCDITYIVGRSDIYTVVSTRLDEHYKNIVKNIDRTMIAYEMIRQVNKMSEDHAGQEFYNVLHQGLVGLNDNAINQDVSRLWFDLALLNVSGHAPELYMDSEGVRLDQAKSYAFDVEAMKFSISKHNIVDVSQIKFLRLAADAVSPKELSRIEGAAVCATKLRQLTSVMIKTTVT